MKIEMENQDVVIKPKFMVLDPTGQVIKSFQTNDIIMNGNISRLFLEIGNYTYYIRHDGELEFAYH